MIAEWWALQSPRTKKVITVAVIAFILWSLHGIGGDPRILDR